jgi:hypothetical protein
LNFSKPPQKIRTGLPFSRRLSACASGQDRTTMSSEPTRSENRSSSHGAVGPTISAVDSLRSNWDSTGTTSGLANGPRPPPWPRSRSDQLSISPPSRVIREDNVSCVSDAVIERFLCRTDVRSGQLSSHRNSSRISSGLAR